MRSILPCKGRGTTRRVVEGHPRLLRAVRKNAMCPSTMLRMVPLPVPGRIYCGPDCSEGTNASFGTCVIRQARSASPLATTK